MKANCMVIALLLISISCQRPKTQNNDVADPVREDIEWLNVWLPHTNDTLLPRVLLIGNSITQSYSQGVTDLLKDKAYVGQLTTSKSLGDPALIAEVSLILQQATFNVIHFNNGLHGWGYTEEEYANSFPQLIQTLKEYAPSATLIWASSTPFRSGEGMVGFDPLTERVKERNKIALEAISGHGIAINDLFASAELHPEYYTGGDGVHLNKDGVNALAAQVASVIEQALAN
jgi:hypothetical protein